MGVEGAVLAAVISQGVSAVWVLKFLTGKKAILHLTRKSMWSVIGYNYGAGCYQRLKSAIRFTAIGCIVFTTVVWAILFFEPRFFADVYIRAWNSAAVALNHAKQAVFSSLFRKVIIVVPLTILLPLIGNLGTAGVFWVEPISNVVGGAACFVTMLLTIWLKLKENKEE